MTPTTTPTDQNPDRERLQSEARTASETLRTAQAAYDEVTRRLLILSIHDLLAEHPYIAELSVSSEYCSDDEGGYFHSVNGQLLELPEGFEPSEGWDDYLWSDILSSCEARPEVIAELFELGDAESTSTLSRSALLSLAS